MSVVVAPLPGWVGVSSDRGRALDRVSVMVDRSPSRLAVRFVWGCQGERRSSNTLTVTWRRVNFCPTQHERFQPPFERQRIFTVRGVRRVNLLARVASVSHVRWTGGCFGGLGLRSKGGVGGGAVWEGGWTVPTTCAPSGRLRRAGQPSSREGQIGGPTDHALCSSSRRSIQNGDASGRGGWRF